MRVCTKKKHISHAKSWISMLNSAENGNYKIDTDVSVFHYDLDGNLVLDVLNTGTIASADASELGKFGPNSSVDPKLVNQKANAVINLALKISNINLLED
ncbi:MAG: hypothetical protein J6Y36_03160 [Treponema sp.]|nr:hypothetical protein [Treponema sp.]